MSTKTIDGKCYARMLCGGAAKTANPNEEDLRRLMDYAENPDKTEQRYLISGVNCLPELAYERMMETKRRYGKYSGIVAYHGYMSFKPGEVTPEQCHALGVELAKRLWGDKYEVLVASHRDHEHLHNHFILNSVSFKDGEKFHCPPYYHDTVMAPESDKHDHKDKLNCVVLIVTFTTFPNLIKWWILRAVQVA